MVGLLLHDEWDQFDPPFWHLDADEMREESIPSLHLTVLRTAGERERLGIAARYCAPRSSKTLARGEPLVTIPLDQRTIPGLGRQETKALMFIVLEWRRLAEEHKRAPQRFQHELDTNDVTKHLRTKHPETMKVINSLRRQGLVQLRTRLSGGETGHGWGGSLFGALTPSSTAKAMVDRLQSEE